MDGNDKVAATTAPAERNSSEKKTCAVCGLDHEEIRKHARESLFFTARAICGFKDMTPGFHGRLAAWTEANIRTGNRKMMVLSSRVFFKTSLMCISMAVWLIINNPEVRILIMQQSQEKVREVMNAIRGILRGSTFTHYFPELVPRPHDRFSDHAIDVPRQGNYPESTISARGINSAITGGHFDVHILDDVIGQEQKDSDLEMQSAISWFKNSNPLFVDYLNGIRIVIGTRWALNDLYQYVLDLGNHAVWNVGCYWDSRAAQIGFPETEARSLFPERYPDEVLARMEAETEPDVWSFQYLNVPVVRGLKRFEREFFRYGKWIDYGRKFVADGLFYDVRQAVVSIMVDPAVGETAESDEFAVTVCGWWPRYADAAVLDYYHGRIQPVAQADKLISIYKKWKDFGCKPIVGVEKGGYQAALIHFTLERQRQAQTYFYVEPISHGGQRKVRRIESLQPFYANKQVIHLGDCGALESQLLGFQPRADGSTGLLHDDIIDSLAYHPKYWKGVNYVAKPDPNASQDLEDWLEDETQKNEGKVIPVYGLETTT